MHVKNFISKFHLLKFNWGFYDVDRAFKWFVFHIMWALFYSTESYCLHEHWSIKFLAFKFISVPKHERNRNELLSNNKAHTWNKKIITWKIIYYECITAWNQWKATAEIPVATATAVWLPNEGIDTVWRVKTTNETHWLWLRMRMISGEIQ